MSRSGPHGTPQGRRLIRRAGLYVWGFRIAATVVTATGSALVAWMLSRTGLPFVRTWLITMVVVLAPSAVMLVWQAVRARGREASQERGQDRRPG